MQTEMKTILAMVMAFTGWLPISGMAADKPKISVPQSDGLTRLDLTHLTKAQYLEFGKALMELSKDEKELAKSTKTMLTGMLGLEGNAKGSRMLDIDPIWNRSALFAIVAVGNKIKLDAEDMENWKKACVAVALKTEDKELRLLISVIYASVLSQNEKLPQEKR